MEIATKKTKIFGFVGTDHLRTKIITNDETLEQVSHFTDLGCNMSYQFSNDVEFKLAKFLLLIDTIKRTIFKKVRTETILKTYNTLDKSKRLSWVGHVEKMPDERVVKSIYKWKPHATRPKGRPRLRWDDDVRDDLRKMGVNNWKQKAQERKPRRGIIEQAKTLKEL